MQVRAALASKVSRERFGTEVDGMMNGMSQHMHPPSAVFCVSLLLHSSMHCAAARRNMASRSLQGWPLLGLPIYTRTGQMNVLSCLTKAVAWLSQGPTLCVL